MTILIADDNPDMRRVIRQFLGSINPAHRVLECATGGDALTGYALHRPDLVLMDIRMEGMDGLSAAAAIKSEYPDARVVMVTNFDEPALREEARSVGAEGYVTKDHLRELHAYVA